MAESPRSSTSTPPARDRHQQPELRVARDADQQLGHAVRHHRLDQQAGPEARERLAARLDLGRRPAGSAARAPASLLCATPSAFTATG